MSLFYCFENLFYQDCNDKIFFQVCTFKENKKYVLVKMSDQIASQENKRIHECKNSYNFTRKEIKTIK